VAAPRDHVLARPLTRLARSPREALAWLGLLAIALVSRFIDLGARAMSHDESLHAFYSWQLFTTGVYRHDPAYHGPLLFHLNALAYWLLGVSDTSARVVPALAGVGLAGSLYLFRPYLGRAGAWLAASLVVLSPTLLFYSRCLWSDIYVAVLSVLWIYGAFRYVVDRRLRFLVLVTAAMALSFLAKEVTFIFGAIIGTFFLALFAVQLRHRGEPWHQSAAGDLAVVMLSLALPLVSGAGHGLLGWEATDYTSSRGLLRSAALGALLAALGALLAWLWFGRRRADHAGPGFRHWLRLFGLFWGLQAPLFTTFFTNVPAGLASGVAGSLGYWLAQHPVARGGQPFFYYLLLGALYEFLVLVLGACGLVAVCRRLVAAREIAPGHDAAPRAAPDPAGTFLVFCAWWAAASWVAYAWAGEKMPWLLIHLLLPLCFLGGWWLARVLHAVDWRNLRWPDVVVFGGGAPALLWMTARLVQTEPFAGRHLGDVAATSRWALEAVATAVLAALLVKAIRATGGRNGRRLAGVALVGFAGLLAARTGAHLAYVNYDLASELLVYAHGTPDIKTALAEIKLISERTTGAAELEVAYDDASTWPLVWYLRDYRNARFYGTEPTEAAMAAPVIIVGPKNAHKVWPYVARGHIRRDYGLISWPIQDYASATWSDVAQVLLEAERRRRLWHFIFYRRLPGMEPASWPHRQVFTMYVSRDVARQVWSLAPPAESVATASSTPVPQLAWRSQEVYVGPYGGARLRAPTALAVAPDGKRVIADSGNDRIVVLNRDGSFRLAFGSRCALTQRPPAGCVDPDGDGPLAVGDGQFHEPWGVAVDSRGEIYVADTWNGRIQVFDAEGRFLRRWGRFGQPSTADPGGALFTLYGPRGLAVDGDGALVVADTGNKRVLRFSRRGEPLQHVGGAGRIPGRFAEPVGVAYGPLDGSIYVADTWNRRIQRLDQSLEPVAQWPVPGWDGQQLLNKPYVAVNGRGTVYASAPEHSRVLLFDARGRLEAALRLEAPVGSSTASVPLGLAVDPASDTLLVADRANDRVLVVRHDAPSRRERE
jgi:uncharacterized protein (TIGR03663 family)